MGTAARSQIEAHSCSNQDNTKVLTKLHMDKEGKNLPCFVIFKF